MNQVQLRDTVFSFLRQREKAYTYTGQIEKAKDVQTVLVRIEAKSRTAGIEKAVAQHRDTLLRLLPSPTGKHAPIRLRMIDVIQACRA